MLSLRSLKALVACPLNFGCDAAIFALPRIILDALGRGAKHCSGTLRFADFQRRFLGAMALLHPPETHVRW
jgi:hypothetical protein